MFKKFRRFVIAVLTDPNDREDDPIVPLPDPNNEDIDLYLIRNNDLYHHALALNALHIRVGGVEAKLNFIQSLIVMVLGIAISPHVNWLIEQVVKGVS